MRRRRFLSRRVLSSLSMRVCSENAWGSTYRVCKYEWMCWTPQRNRTCIGKGEEITSKTSACKRHLSLFAILTNRTCRVLRTRVWCPQRPRICACKRLWRRVAKFSLPKRWGWLSFYTQRLWLQIATKYLVINDAAEMLRMESSTSRARSSRKPYLRKVNAASTNNDAAQNSRITRKALSFSIQPSFIDFITAISSIWRLCIIMRRVCWEHRGLYYDLYVTDSEKVATYKHRHTLKNTDTRT